MPNIKSKKDKIGNYLNTYKKGPKNCFDCRFFRCRIPIAPSGEIHYTIALATCKLHALLHDMPGSSIEVQEPSYPMDTKMRAKLKTGWRHYQWNFANVCEDFDSMLEEEDAQKNKGKLDGR